MTFQVSAPTATCSDPTTTSPKAPSLAYTRGQFFAGFWGLEEVIEAYKKWVADDRFLLFKKLIYEREELRQLWIVVKASKRGNDVYFRRVFKRFAPILKMPDVKFFNPKERGIKKTRLLFVTLTWDIKIDSLSDAWSKIGEDFNRYMAGLRKKFGRISYIRVWESFESGYPHIHLLVYFHDSEFRVFLHKGKFRILQKQEFENWHSFVDVQGLPSLHIGLRYVLKYLTKGYLGDPKGILTFSLCWLFRKQSFAVSQRFTDDLILVSVIKTRARRNLVQLTLFGGVSSSYRVEILFVGVFRRSDLGISESNQSIRLVFRKCPLRIALA